MHLLTKYEVCQVVALRALMIYDGAPILLPWHDGCCDARDAVIDVARQELAAGLLRFKVVRCVDGRQVEVDSGDCRLPDLQ
jgi:DNA-directed RNA polymerase subunit K/omega